MIIHTPGQDTDRQYQWCDDDGNLVEVTAVTATLHGTDLDGMDYSDRLTVTTPEGATAVVEIADDADIDPGLYLYVVTATVTNGDKHFLEYTTLRVKT